MLRIGATLLLLCGTSAAVHGQSSAHPMPGPWARIVVIAPKADRAAAFEAAYQRHLKWHRACADPWSWYGWSFVLGERLGMFMDGTFGHAPTNFDHAVDPAGDAEDNARNVAPHADFLSHGVYERIDAVSRGAALPDASPFLVLSTYRLVPGRSDAFEAWLHARAAASGRSESQPRYSWYRLRLGGSIPEYLLMHAADSWATAVSLTGSFDDMLADGTGERVPPDVIDEARTELLRYRPSLSYHPGAGQTSPPDRCPAERS